MGDDAWRRVLFRHPRLFWRGVAHVIVSNSDRAVFSAQ
jgi:hypothetical protein